VTRKERRSNNEKKASQPQSQLKSNRESRLTNDHKHTAKIQREDTGCGDILKSINNQSKFKLTAQIERTTEAKVKIR